MKSPAGARRFSSRRCRGYIALAGDYAQTREKIQARFTQLLVFPILLECAHDAALLEVRDGVQIVRLAGAHGGVLVRRGSEGVPELCELRQTRGASVPRPPRRPGG